MIEKLQEIIKELQEILTALENTKKAKTYHQVVHSDHGNSYTTNEEDVA